MVITCIRNEQLLHHVDFISCKVIHSDEFLLALVVDYAYQSQSVIRRDFVNVVRELRWKLSIRCRSVVILRLMRNPNCLWWDDFLELLLSSLKELLILLHLILDPFLLC